MDHRRGCSSPCRRPFSRQVLQTTKSVTYIQFDAKPTVTYLASKHHCPSTIKVYCLVTEAGVRERFVHAVLNSALGETRTRDLSITGPTFCP